MRMRGDFEGEGGRLTERMLLHNCKTLPISPGSFIVRPELLWMTVTILFSITDLVSHMGLRGDAQYYCQGSWDLSSLAPDDGDNDEKR